MSAPYRVIQLNQLSWRDFVDRKNPVASALMSKMSIAPSDRWRVKLECLRLLATFRLDNAKMRLISGFIDTYLPLDGEELSQFQHAIGEVDIEEQEGLMEIVTSWMLEGLEKGRVEGVQQGLRQGLQQGLQQGKEQIVMRLLRRRFEFLSDLAQSRIQGLSETDLDDLAEAQFDFQRPSDLDDWLAVRSS